jgi:hypothetical protein
MKASELIEKLKAFPPESEVMIENYEFDNLEEITDARLVYARTDLRRDPENLYVVSYLQEHRESDRIILLLSPYEIDDQGPK